MLDKILSANILYALQHIKSSALQELRFRVDQPVIVRVGGEGYYLANNGLTRDRDDAMITSMQELKEMVLKSADYSLYAINDQLIKGFVTLAGGVRIGICGEVVVEEGKIKTIKNITSLNIRIPHEVRNCSMPLYNVLMKGGQLQNTLVVSSPGCGKTTFIRDLAMQVGKREEFCNVLICDERCEITGIDQGKSSMLDGFNCDIIANCSKKYAFENGIRSMRPDVIVTDEINLEEDIEAIKNALTSGVKVVATIHAKDIHDLKKKDHFRSIVADKLFDRYVVLSDRNGVGTCEGVFNENLACIYV